MKKLVYILSFLLVSSLAFAQPATQMIKVMVAPDHDDWTYKIGEKVTFSVTVLKWGNPLKNTKITYDLTHQQLNYLKTLNEELEDRKKKGEVNLTIKYINNVPTICSIQQQRSTTAMNIRVRHAHRRDIDEYS